MHGNQRPSVEADREGEAASKEGEEFVTALLTASRALVGVSARSLADVEDTVTIAQFRVLVLLTTHEPTTLVQLAARLGVNASTAQRQVERLVRDGLVDRHEDPEDRRQVVIAPTEHGARLVEAVTERRRNEIARIVQAVPSEDRAGLVAALEAFAVAANEPRVDSTVHPLGW